MTNETKEKIKEEWVKFVESQMWQGEDEFTKNIGVGNVADWWLSKLYLAVKEERARLVEKIKDKWELSIDKDLGTNYSLVPLDDIISFINQDK